MSVLFSAVACILMYSKILVAQETSTDISTISTIPDIEALKNCTGLDPPINETITPKKTSADLTWSVVQTNSNCNATRLVLNCEALWEENQDGWQWTTNATLDQYFDEIASSITVKVTNLTEYTNYTCSSILYAEFGQSTSTWVKFRTEAEISSPPTNLILVETTSTSFKISWDKPEKNPGQFIEYQVGIVTTGSNHFIPSNCENRSTNQWNPTTDQQFVFLEAFPDYIYVVSVKVKNSAGIGAAENISFTTNPSASEPPSQFTLESSKLFTDENKITQVISWNSPCNPNGPIEEFIVEIEGYYTLNSSFSDIRKLTFKASNKETYTNETIENIMPASKYTFRIQANGINETGKFAVFTTITEDNYPTTPILSNIESQSTYFVISWNEPERRAGKIIEYSIVIDVLGPKYDTDPERCIPIKNSVNKTVEGGSYKYNYTNAHPYYIYNISVAALTSRGSGPLTSNVTETELSVPERPDNLTFTPIDEYTNGVVAWKTPCYLNGPIHNFSVILNGNYSEDGSSPTTSETSILYENYTYSYSYTFPLKESYKYEVSVWVVLQDGTGGEVEKKDLTTPDGYPGPPSMLNITQIESTSFTISWNAPATRNGRILEYQINVTSFGPLYDTHCELNDTKTYTLSTMGNETLLKFNNGEPYSNYSISIRAKTIRGWGNITEAQNLTNQSIPENVYGINHHITYPTKEEYNGNVTISFQQPCRINGLLKKYEIVLNGTRPGFPFIFYSLSNQNGEPFDFPLKPQYEYRFSIITNNEYYSNSSQEETFEAPTGVPQFADSMRDLQINTRTSDATVTIKKNFFNNINGDIQYVALILSELNKTGGEFSTWKDWPIVKKHGYYQLTRNFWEPFRDDDVVTFTIGNETSCNPDENYCNQPLQNNQDYYLIIRIFTKHFYKNSPAIHFITKDTSKLGIILGIIFGILAVALLGVAGFFIWRKKIMKLPQMYPRKSSVKAHTEGNTSIPINKFVQYCKNLENNPEKFMEQYMLLTEKSKEIMNMHTTTFAELTENRRKNRYTNILPYDATRVKLLIDEDDEIGSDYINASYIKGFSGKIEYIATQGPLFQTCRDFWKMVIQENVSIIVMVTQFVEDNKEKCYKYFPNNHENMIIDDMEVRCTMELHFGTYCVRTIEVKRESVQVTVTHMQYLDWPDFNVPNGTQTMLQFCYQLRERLKAEGGHVIVHCSAGVGRTGTLIATDILIQNIHAGKELDIFNTVLELRKQRKLMVQAQKQYVYIHHLIRDAIDQSHSTGPYDDLEEPIFENQSALQLKTDDDNLISNKKETESQF